MKFRWSQNLDGVYYRTLGFCADEDCGSTQGWEGKTPDVARGGGMVRGSYFFECETCGRKSFWSVEEREARMEAIFAAQKVEAAHVPFPLLSYGTRGRVQFGALGFEAEVIGYGRDPGCGYVLNGTMTVRTRERVQAWYAKGAMVDIGTSVFLPEPRHALPRGTL